MTLLQLTKQKIFCNADQLCATNGKLWKLKYLPYIKAKFLAKVPSSLEATLRHGHSDCSYFMLWVFISILCSGAFMFLGFYVLLCFLDFIGWFWMAVNFNGGMFLLFLTCFIFLSCDGQVSEAK